MATELTEQKRELQRVKAEINRLCGLRDKAALQDTDNAAAIFTRYAYILQPLCDQVDKLGHIVRAGERQRRIEVHNKRVAARREAK